jgi:hypothetical protein
MKVLVSLMIILTGVGSLAGQEVEIEGEVVEVKSVIDDRYDIEVLEAEVKMPDGRLLRAQLSPEWYLGTDVKAGDIITLKGQYDEQNQFMVRRMEHKAIARELRSMQYEPLWMRPQVEEREIFYNKKTEREMRANIEELYIDRKSHLMEAVIRTQDGMRYRAKIAPVQYLENRLRVGDNIEIKGSEVKAQKDVIILGREIKNLRTQKDIILRNAEGFPDWREEGVEFKQDIEQPVDEPEESEE